MSGFTKGGDDFNDTNAQRNRECNITTHRELDDPMGTATFAKLRKTEGLTEVRAQGEGRHPTSGVQRRPRLSGAPCAFVKPTKIHQVRGATPLPSPKELAPFGTP